MTSFSGCFFLVSMVVWFQFLFGFSSTMASTKYIDTICNHKSINNKTFCFQTLTAYPPSVSATNLVKLVKIVTGLGASHAKKTAAFVAELAKEPTFKRHFKMCKESYRKIVTGLRGAISEIDDDPLGANYSVMICYDETAIVKNEVGKNTDNASKRLMEMTILMDKFINIAAGATDTVQGSDY